MSIMRRLATATANWLRDEQWSLAFTPEVAYRPTRTLESLSTLACTVAARTMTLTPWDRSGTAQKRVQIEINFQQRIDPQTGVGRDELLDNLVELLEEVANRLEPGTVFTELPEVSVAEVAIANDQPFVIENLDDLNAFNGSVVVTFVSYDDEETG